MPFFLNCSGCTLLTRYWMACFTCFLYLATIKPQPASRTLIG